MIETLKYEVEVTKEANDIGVALKTIVVEAKKAAEDGFQAGTDISVVAIASFGPLMEAMKGIDKIDDEFKENTPAAVMAIVLPLVEILNAFLKKPVVETPEPKVEL